MARTISSARKTTEPLVTKTHPTLPPPLTQSGQPSRSMPTQTGRARMVMASLYEYRVRNGLDPMAPISSPPPTLFQRNGPFRFMDLPPELRVRVYTFKFANQEAKINEMKIPSIARTSRVVRTESLPLYFSEINFTITVERLNVVDASFIISKTDIKHKKRLLRESRKYNPNGGSLGIRKSAVGVIKAAKCWAPVLFRHVELLLDGHGSILVDWSPKSGLTCAAWKSPAHPLPAWGLRAGISRENVFAVFGRVEKALERTAGREGFAGFSVYDLRKAGWAGARFQTD